MVALPHSIWSLFVLTLGLQVVISADSFAQPQNVNNLRHLDDTRLNQKQWMGANDVEAVDMKREASATFPPPSHQSIIKPLLPSLSTGRMQTDLNMFTSFYNRYYKSPDGQKSSAWLLSQIRYIINGRASLSVVTVAHSWPQSSIVVKWRGRTSGPVTILSSSQDSINAKNPLGGRAPGADRSGSGTVALLEVLRVMVNADYQPNTPLELHWYAASEVGLLGSNAIASSYKRDSVSVKSLLHLSQIGFFKPGTTELIVLQSDNADPGLNTFIQRLIASYSRLPSFMDKGCGYLCEDHMSWYEQGYSTAILYEAPYEVADNPLINSSEDTTSVLGFNWQHALEFTKIALSYAIEQTS